MIKGKFTFLGTGNMAGAIIGGITKEYPDDAIAVFDVDESKYEKYKGRSFTFTHSAKEAVEEGTFIFLSVKPQNFAELLGGIKESGASLDGKTFISIAAGISTGYICRLLGREVPVIRTMPNTPMLAGKGVTALSRNALVSDKVFSAVCKIFASAGEAFTLPESKMNDIIAVTSSSPAYVFLFIKSIVDGARELGFDGDNMLDIVCKTVIGSAELLRTSGKSADEMIRMVCSPKGTTEKAMDALREGKFEESVIDAMKRCTDRANELSSLN